MKKILFLLLICVIKLSAYEYPIYIHNAYNLDDKYFVNNENGVLQIKYLRNNSITYYNLNDSSQNTYIYLYRIKNNINVGGYIFTTNEVFEGYLKSDLNFLNDFYVQGTNYILNYFYNDYYFDKNNYISYDNYELFYNEDGLAVESKVNGIYKGLYDDIGKSGILYNSVGEVVLVNGVEPSFLTKQWLKLQNKIINPLLSVFSISNIWKNILCVVVILASLRMLIRYAFKAFLIRLYSKRIKHYENTITRIENA